MRFRTCGLLTAMMAGAAMAQVPAPEPKPAEATPPTEKPVKLEPPAKPKSGLESKAFDWPECDEYISESPCKVTVDLSSQPLPQTADRGELKPHAHWDVQVKPFRHIRNTEALGKAAVLLEYSSPFMTCAVAAVPAAATRDLSANIGSLLTAVAGIGAPPIVSGMAAAAPAGEAAVTLSPQARMPAVRGTNDPEVDALLRRIKALSDVADQIEPGIQDQYSKFRTALKNDWVYSFPSDAAARDAVLELGSTARGVSNALESFITSEEIFTVLENDVTVYEKAHSNAPPELLQKLTRVKAHLDTIKAHVANFADKQKTAQQVLDYLGALSDKPSLVIQALPMAYFSNKTVTETVTCKDGMSNNPVFDNIIFLAYYETLPHIDISIGAIGSLLGGRQVGTITTPFTPAQAAACVGITGCGPATVLGYKTQSAYQFMPGVFGEWRMKNFRCPWAGRNGAPWHPGGYVCSAGIAGGVAINPNNGGPAAEFFEGFSFGIQRFSILIGTHNGRYQEYGGGFYAGEQFPAGTTVAPPTAYRWATHPAFGIAYRIPIR